MSGGHETLPHRLAAAKRGVLIPEQDEWTPFLLAMAKSGGGAGHRQYGDSLRRDPAEPGIQPGGRNQTGADGERDGVTG